VRCENLTWITCRPKRAKPVIVFPNKLLKRTPTGVISEYETLTPFAALVTNFGSKRTCQGEFLNAFIICHCHYSPHTPNIFIPFAFLPGECPWPPPPLSSSDEVKERVELYLCSPFVPSWLVLRWTLPFFAFLLSTCFSRHTAVFKLLFVVVNKIYIYIYNICAVCQGCTNFAQICEASENSGCQNGDKASYTRTTHKHEMPPFKISPRRSGLRGLCKFALYYRSYYACVLRKICDIYFLLINPCICKKC